MEARSFSSTFLNIPNAERGVFEGKKRDYQAHIVQYNARIGKSSFYFIAQFVSYYVRLYIFISICTSKKNIANIILEHCMFTSGTHLFLFLLTFSRNYAFVSRSHFFPILSRTSFILVYYKNMLRYET